MIAVLENVKNREQVLSRDGELDLAIREIDQVDEISEGKVTTSNRGFGLGEELLSLYLDELGQIPLLNGGEERLLGSQIEEGKHLSRLEKDLLAENGGKPAAIHLLLALVERLSRAHLLFEALYQYLELPSHGSIAEKVLHTDLRRAIDGTIDQNLSCDIGKIIEESQSKTEQALIQLSLDSRLIPWHIIEEASQKSSSVEFGEVLQSSEFHDKLEEHHAEIVKHFQQIREKAHQAAEHMIQANLRLVVGMAKRYISWGVPLPDIIQEGNIGLMQAVQKFDHRRGYKFSTYAIPWIWQAINRAVNDQSRIVRLPGHVVDALTKLVKAKNSLSQELCRPPTEQELASETGFPPKKIESLLKLNSRRPVSFETPVGDEGSQLGDFIADRAILQPEEEATASLLKEKLSKTLDSLTPRERRIIELRFGLGNEYSRTLEEVGAELGLTKERIRQLEKEALAKLRHPSHSRELIEYIG